MKRFTLLMLGAMITGLCYSQEPLTYEDMNLSLGTEFRIYQVTSDFIGSPGTEQVWDFTNLFPEGQQDVSTFEYGSTGGEGQFPDANFTWSFNFETLFQYYTIDEDEYSYHGVYEEGGITFVYDNPLQYAALPVEYEGTFMDMYSAAYNLGTVQGTIEGTYEGEVDGHGILQMPWGDVLNVYRVSGSLNQTEIFDFQGEPVEATYTGTLTTFFAPGYPGPLINVQSGVVSIPDLGVNQAQQQTTYLGDFEFLGVDDIEIVEDLNVFPNPSNGVFTLTFENASNRNISLEVLDIQGRVVHAEAAIGSGFGSVRHEFDLSGLRPGFYLLRLSDGDRFQGRKIQVVR
jgi:hypothetical protein